MLTPEQVDTFKHDGALILPGLFTEDEVKQWRHEVDDYFGHPASGDDWRAALRHHKSDSFHLRDDPTPSTHPALREVYASLHASAEWSGENEFLPRPGKEPIPWLGPRAPHIDFPLHAPLRTLANSVIYLSDVQTRGGAFMYWPGSHHQAWDYFHRNPQDYLSRGNRSQDDTFAILRRELDTTPHEFVANAGDVLIWHPLLFHSATVNTQADTRIALFGRWGVALHDEPVFDFAGNRWSSWEFTAPAMSS